jgi:bifunctional DNA primase/polymerase-like protein
LEKETELSQEMVTAALGYAARGWPVFPVHPTDKRPRTRHGFKDATLDSRLIEDWWLRRWPGSGIALAVPEGLLVLDIDPRNGGVRGPELPTTKEAGTRSGGAHLYYAVPPDLSFVGQYQPGIDVKAPGKGYVILPPTPGYVWKFRHPIADLPGDVLESCTRSTASWGLRGDATAKATGARYLPWEDATRYGEVALQNQIGAVEHAQNGERNNTLFKATVGIVRLIAGGELREEYALGRLMKAAREVGLGKDEVVQCMRSAYEAGKDDPRRAQ